MCAVGKIPGAVKFGRSWAIPCDAERPVDKRITWIVFVLEGQRTIFAGIYFELSNDKNYFKKKIRHQRHNKK